MKEIKLPKKPSDLIRLALRDLRKILNRKSRDVNVYMSTWFDTYADGYEGEKPVNPKCSVCFAGAVMFGTMGKGKRPPAWEEQCPEKFIPWNERRFYALNNFREGAYIAALRGMGYDDTFLWSDKGMKMQKEIDDANIEFCGEVDGENEKPFFESQRQLARILKKHGL